jgi:hypothetical protein
MPVKQVKNISTTKQQKRKEPEGELTRIFRIFRIKPIILGFNINRLLSCPSCSSL